MSTQEMPLFPLTTAVFPGGVLPLRIFEPRYLSMVSRCMREGSGFVVCLAHGGGDADRQARPGRVGTRVRITDFDRLEDGMLSITAEGEHRVLVASVRQQADGLWLGEVEDMPDEAGCALPDGYSALAELLGEIHQQLGPPFTERASHYDDAGWVSARLAELLPMAPETREELLAMDSPILRLERLHPIIARIARRGR